MARTLIFLKEGRKAYRTMNFWKKLQINAEIFTLHCISSFSFGSGKTDALGVLITSDLY